MRRLDYSVPTCEEIKNYLLDSNNCQIIFQVRSPSSSTMVRAKEIIIIGAGKLGLAMAVRLKPLSLATMTSLSSKSQTMLVDHGDMTASKRT